MPLRAIRLIALAHLVIGTLDAGRWHLAEVPGVLRAIALLLMVPSALFVVQAMRANRFFSPVVRVQRGAAIGSSIAVPTAQSVIPGIWG